MHSNVEVAIFRPSGVFPECPTCATSNVELQNHYYFASLTLSWAHFSAERNIKIVDHIWVFGIADYDSEVKIIKNSK